MAIEKKPSYVDVECRLCGWLCACGRGTLHTTVDASGAEVTTGNCDECAADPGLDDLCPGHSHDCECGDYRVCTKLCVLEDNCYYGWVCPDCDLTEKLESLHEVELARVINHVFPIKQGEKS